jgi:8-oxo-dGTP diphosphatase
MEVTEAVRAAGGVVWRRAPDGSVEVLVVHRPKYDDWTLPKGKLMPGEDDPAAALREVHEETGLTASIERPVGSVSYRDRFGRPKSVAYFQMRPERGEFVPSQEVDTIRWLPQDAAVSALTYAHDRDLLRAFQPEERRP